MRKGQLKQSGMNKPAVELYIRFTRQAYKVSILNCHLLHSDQDPSPSKQEMESIRSQCAQYMHNVCIVHRPQYLVITLFYLKSRLFMYKSYIKNKQMKLRVFQLEPIIKIISSAVDSAKNCKNGTCKKIRTPVTLN